MTNTDTPKMQVATESETQIIKYCLLLQALLYIIGDLDEFQQGGSHRDIWTSMVEPMLNQLQVQVVDVPIRPEGECVH